MQMNTSAENMLVFIYLSFHLSEYNVEDNSLSLKESDDNGCDTKPTSIPITDTIDSQKQNIKLTGN